MRVKADLADPTKVHFYAHFQFQQFFFTSVFFCVFCLFFHPKRQEPPKTLPRFELVFVL